MPEVAIIGAGPAGLMAAERLSTVDGLNITLFDAMPSPGRKFLMAGKGGLNITHAEPWADFVRRYGDAEATVSDWLNDFSPADLRAWVAALGVDTFIGSSGRVFPRDMKAAPLLRAWIHRLRLSGVRFQMRHRWQGWATSTMTEGVFRALSDTESGSEAGPSSGASALIFQSPAGPVTVRADAVLFALGGGSWAKLGSDGAWVGPFTEQGLTVNPLKPANCGFAVDWQAGFSQRFAGEPLKNIRAWTGNNPAQSVRGELNVTEYGIEGGLVYALAASLREELGHPEPTILWLDLAPDRTQAALTTALEKPRGRDSQANFWRRQLGFTGLRAGLLRECLPESVLRQPAALAAAIKALPLVVTATRPMDEAISTAGGVALGGLNRDLMLEAMPGVFCAGEMLDWEAPTGGYLLTACLAGGYRAGEGIKRWLAPVHPAIAGRSQNQNR